MRINLRIALVALIALVAVGSIWSANFASNRDSNRETAPTKSSDTKRVTLVIDFGSDSGVAVRSFELNDIPQNTTGWNLFGLAHLPVQGTQQFPEGFICRIDGRPNLREQNCTDTPSFAEGHWAYYVTNHELSSGWILSGQGAATHIPECGSYEGWSWVPGGTESKPPRFETSTRACK
jgi:hypothetical protein